ncbi:MAG: undecaprenyl-diphosphate phosphatase [Candidatus Fermentithermobacillus carboniphilus]|uniref:Undecaprenyl-diphosphatase n=1 Tax=Candidatus Fermentithermobacillus carboniphilus TaxID=3085328 RepID=A0AAT9LCS3_9FIRM|nr:MAG: undecaprenyl-diphosphate phosphatase [Candidatus Fermentithermobacillus carboniphilus]
MTGWHALILGIIQGLTEFLPVSSSGHLILGSRFLGLPAPGLSFSIAAHVGTAVATIGMFRDEIAWLVRDIFGRGRGGKIALANIIIGSIPAALVGLLFKGAVEALFSTPLAASVGLLVTGCVLKISGRGRERAFHVETAEDYGKKGTGIPSCRKKNRQDSRPNLRILREDNGHTPLSTVTTWRALVTGIAQAIAIVPGISRSGMTITAGLLSGMSREDSAKFSFLLALPATLGAALLDLKDLLGTGAETMTAQLLIGAIVSLITGVFAISLTYNFVRRGSLDRFAYYCWALGLLSLFVVLR